MDAFFLYFVGGLPPSARIASFAGRGLANDNTPPEQRSVDGFTLAARQWSLERQLTLARFLRGPRTAPQSSLAEFLESGGR